MDSSYKVTILSNATDWCYFCWKNYLDQHKEVDYYKFFFPLPFNSRYFYKIINKLYDFRFLKNNGSYIFRPLIYLIIDCFFRLNNNEKNILIMYDWNPLATDKKFIKKLKRKYHQIIIVYVFTNIVKYTGAKTRGFLYELKKYYDVVFAFDKKDALNYDFSYLPLIYAQEPLMLNDQNKEDIDIFYVGKAKDRLDILHEVYEKAKSEGLKCDFNIIEVPYDKQKDGDDIHYNKTIPYEAVIKKIKRSKCLLDVIQSDSTGLTIKVAESVIYDKKLITNNPNVQYELKMNSQNLLLYDSRSSLLQFVGSSKCEHDRFEIDHFSPELFIDRLKVLFDTKYSGK